MVKNGPLKNKNVGQMLTKILGSYVLTFWADITVKSRPFIVEKQFPNISEKSPKQLWKVKNDELFYPQNCPNTAINFFKNVNC